MDANINYRVLKLARERINLDLPTAARKIGISNHYLLAAAEAGNRKITFRQAERAAHVYDIPIAFLYLDDIPDAEFPLLDFRLHPDASGKELRPRLMKDVFKAMRQRETILELYQELGISLSSFDLSCQMDEEPEEVGRRTRALLPSNLFSNKSQRIKRTISFFESLGIYVVQVGGANHTKVDYGDFDGAAIYHQNCPIVLINTHERSNNRQIFTLFHELTHLMLKNRVITDFYSGIETAVSDEILRVETFCNKVAAATLVPRDELIGLAKELDHAGLADHFRVSREVIVIRLRNLGLLDQTECDTLLLTYQREYQNRQSDGDGRPNPNVIKARNMGNMFVSAVKEGLAQGKLSYYEALIELKMKDRPARKLLYGS